MSSSTIEHTLSLLSPCRGCHIQRLDMILDVTCEDGFRCSDCTASSSSKIKIPWFIHLQNNIHPWMKRLAFKLHQDVLLLHPHATTATTATVRGTIVDFCKERLSYKIQSSPEDTIHHVSMISSSILPSVLSPWKRFFHILPPCPLCKKKRLDMTLDTETFHCICCSDCATTSSTSILPWFKTLLHTTENIRPLLPWKIGQYVDVYLSHLLSWSEGLIVDIDLKTLSYKIRISHWNIDPETGTMSDLLSFPLFENTFQIATHRTHCKSDWRDAIQYYTHIECLSCSQHGFHGHCKPTECGGEKSWLRWKLYKILYYCPVRQAILILTTPSTSTANVEWVYIYGPCVRYVWEWE